jgi:hypothetical protein
MNEFYRAKLNELLSEFTRYLAVHPAFAQKIPNGAEVILLDKRDAAYNRYVLSKVKSEHEIVYVDVGELAPVKSRLKRPRVVENPHVYAG